ncbi:MAG: hypothetical protein M3373_11545 [Gemmatimonadota bacterium]|nr:hypothetical protein [Gemmatimonadota bacterium]
MRIVPAGMPSQGAHHTEYELGTDDRLFANAFGSGRTFLFDVRDRAEPKVVTAFGDVGPYSHPHSYARLTNGHVIATFQWRVGGGPPGGLVELDKDGKPVRWASATTAEADSSQIVPYSLVVLPKLDRIVSTSTHMIEDVGVHVQIWRLSDLELLRTLAIPVAGEHVEHATHSTEHHRLPGEPRVLADGRTVMFGTFTCGLYHITGVDGSDPRVSFSYAFPGANCAVPVVVGKYWIQTVPQLHALVALDVSNPAHPVEASRLVFGDDVRPHWLAADASGRRLVTSSSSKTDPTLHIVEFDPTTGALTRRRDAPVLDLRRVQWPDGSESSAVPHGVVFSRD